MDPAFVTAVSAMAACTLQLQPLGAANMLLRTCMKKRSGVAPLARHSWTAVSERHSVQAPCICLNSCYHVVQGNAMRDPRFHSVSVSVVQALQDLQQRPRRPCNVLLMTES